jgi:hypothetical protein
LQRHHDGLEADDDDDIGSFAPQKELSEEEMKASIDAILAMYKGRPHEVRACWNACLCRFAAC